MTVKDLMKRLKNYDEDTMILFGEYNDSKNVIGWDNIELVDLQNGNLYMLSSRDLEINIDKIERLNGIKNENRNPT